MSNKKIDEQRREKQFDEERKRKIEQDAAD